MTMEVYGHSDMDVRERSVFVGNRSQTVLFFCGVLSQTGGADVPKMSPHTSYWEIDGVRSRGLRLFLKSYSDPRK